MINYVGEHNKQLMSSKQLDKVSFVESKSQTLDDNNKSCTIGYASNGFLFIFNNSNNTCISFDSEGTGTKQNLTIEKLNYLFEKQIDKLNEEYDIKRESSKVEYPTTIYLEAVLFPHIYPIYKIVGKDVYIHGSNNDWTKLGNRAKGNNIARNKSYVLDQIALGKFKITKQIFGEENVNQISSKYCTGRLI